MKLQIIFAQIFTLEILNERANFIKARMIANMIPRPEVLPKISRLFELASCRPGSSELIAAPVDAVRSENVQRFDAVSIAKY